MPYPNWARREGARWRERGPVGAETSRDADTDPCLLPASCLVFQIDRLCHHLICPDSCGCCVG